MNASDQVLGLQYANGTTESYSYSGNTNQLATQHLTGASASHSAAYQYTLALQLQSKQINYGVTSQNAASNETYTYDALNRLYNRQISLNPTGSAPADFNMSQAFRYDGFGNFTSQTGTGTYQYNTQGQLSIIAGYNRANIPQFTSATYDNNGNLTHDGIRTFAYTSYNKMHTVTQSPASTSDSVQFSYGINHQRYARTQTVANQTTHTAYLSGGIEKVVKGNHIQYRSTIANVVLTDSNADLEHSEAYYHKDRQGSPLTITNQNGQAIQQFAYGPFGQVHQLQTNSSLFAGGIAPSQRHYTGHESVTDFNLIHMNGRMYDPSIGRFIQADPFIQQINNSQNFNRYSYVLNDPINHTDPSGYFFKNVLRAFASVPLLNTAITVGLNFIPQCAGGWCSALYSGASTYAVTGSLGHSARAGIVGWGLSAGHGLVGAHSAVGSFANIYGNALVAGFGAKLGGGQFNHAFIAAGFSAAFKSIINDIGGTNSANAAIKEGNLGKLNIHKVDRIIASALIGGTASKLSGGKFANGALSGALAQMYNGEVFSKEEILRNQRISREYNALRVKLEKFAVDNPDKPIPILKAEMQLIANKMTAIAMALPYSHPFSEAFYAQFETMDTFLYGGVFEGRGILYEGGIYQSGDINYIAIGALFREYWIPRDFAEIASSGWNMLQFAKGEGSQNLTQSYRSARWLQFGYHNYWRLKFTD